jgi:predicted heme/steroid binding protein
MADGAVSTVTTPADVVGVYQLGMGLSYLPFIYLGILAVLWFFSPEDRQEQVRGRLSGGRDGFLALAVGITFAVVLSYIFSGSLWMRWVAVLGTVAAVAQSFWWIYGAEEAKLQDGLDLPEDVRRRMEEDDS